MASTTVAGPLTKADVGEIVIYVRDFERMLAFYRDTLGLATDVKTDGVAGLRGERGAEIVLHHSRTAGEGEGKNWLLEFIVDDIDAVVQELRARGVEVGEIERRPYGKYARFADPDGNRLGLEQAPERQS